MNNRICCYDPETLRTFFLNADQYFNYENEIDVIPFRGSEREFLVVDVEQDVDKATTIVESQYMTTFRDIQIKFARLTVQPAKDDLKSVYQVDCHFGSILNCGDSVLGYDIKSMPIYEDL